MSAWDRDADICAKIAHTSSKLSAWSKNTFGDYANELKACRNEMEMLMGGKPNRGCHSSHG